jgi:hypothetical protein
MKRTKLTGFILAGTMALVAVAQAAEPAAEIDAVVAVAEGIPGGVAVTTLAIQAKVIAIDYADRMLEVLLPGGVTEIIQIGPEAVNFNQIKVGDMVDAVVTQELVIGMGAPDAELGDGEEVVVVAAAPGEEPGVIAADTIQMTAEVVALDGLSRTATLMFEDGEINTVVVRDDIDLTKYRLGDKVVFQMTEMVAISVEKQ